MADHAHNLRTDFSGGQRRPIGVITRGTTGHNRLRRADRWIAHSPLMNKLMRGATHPLAIDLGYGASHTTTVEWARWLRGMRPDVRVIGLEIHPDRVLPPHEGVEFQLGGFELAGHRPHLVRAFNVLRQYDVDQVEHAWATITSHMHPTGLLVEGTCDELGRRCSWITISHEGPLSLTLAWDPFDVTQPSDVAERLPKALIHRNTPGNRIHKLLQHADDAWRRTAALAPYGPRVRWRQAHTTLINEGVPLVPQRRPLRDCVLTVPWDVVKP
ncbi:class I SAM-dependent methyltransferase [Corynebacterium sp. 153RC1]|uniref:class I SAM-dependent methyltransferase n=1 Tax=unclassified Corynebacterium TaxID=2624378 RepID=UPI00211BDC1B|nr:MULTISPECIES: class I SAM-dependent methyltransferase [unclassified Corynebacterium]MCQ9351758.1 class I SAM-dependent methyltransferase [Corynebacterium sp. 209RC1]MCQ9354494.1 class I SAM-dependent methyltransferase [Corynebacterium sp. 1222RC1]MCQ9356040.1 class I SAM-dependent methyltransferase [Corynebacterium sp. 122RC1]MCQ9358672.1 class I SAM-dependent methyltransferase [Corynebacterium sp. 142RC1]MCQ9360654.1 class I SAM-dependent methyltransferase [Corynebacterium sp. 153RC1]